jgi:hypothetical protein
MRVRQNDAVVVLKLEQERQPTTMTPLRSGRLIENTDVLASPRSDHDALE